MDWHPTALLFPLLTGADMDALVASIKETKGNKEQPIVYRMKGNKKQFIDGRNRFAACERAGVKPTLKRIELKDKDVDAYILRRNAHRRHLPTEVRDKIIAQLLAAGESIRKTADLTGASKSKVQRIAEETARPVKVAGKDGRTYELPTCARCKRLGTRVKDCPACKGLAQQREREPGVEPEPRKGPPAGQIEFDWVAFDGNYGGMVRLIDRFYTATKAANSPNHIESLKTLATLRERLAEQWQQSTGRKAPSMRSRA